MNLQITYRIALDAGRDAGNKRMRSEGRTTWNRDDYDHAAAVTNKLLGIEQMALPDHVNL